jgi:hypothetical protein
MLCVAPMKQAPIRGGQLATVGALILGAAATLLYYLTERSVEFTALQWPGFGSLVLGAGFAGADAFEWASRRKPGRLAIVDLAIALGAASFGYLMLVTADSPDHGSVGSLLVASMFVLTIVRRRMDGAPGASDGPAGGGRGR